MSSPRVSSTSSAEPMTADASDPFEESRDLSEEAALLGDAEEASVAASADAVPAEDGVSADDGGGEEVAGPGEPSPYDRPGEWFVVHTYAGYENKVKSNLASRVRSMNMEDKIYECVIPMEDVIEFKNGKK